MDHSSQTKEQLVAALEAAQERVAALEGTAHEAEARLAACFQVLLRHLEDADVVTEVLGFVLPANLEEILGDQ